MTENEIDPLVKRAVADAVLERASTQLGELLRELAAALDPFPNFLGMSTIQAVEVESSGVAESDRGCVVICPDGQLYELVLRMVPGPIDIGGVEQVDELRELDLSPGNYVAYAYAAVRELTHILEERDG